MALGHLPCGRYTVRQRYSGVDANETHLSKALALGLIDKAIDLTEAASCYLILVCVPVSASLGVISNLLDKVGPESLVMDAG